MTASKPATAKTKPGRPKKDETPAFDFSTLEFREAEMPKPPSNNPFTKPLGESYEYDTARAVVIPAAGQARAESLLRRAAAELSIGVSIGARVIENEDGSETGNIELIFKGKPRRKRKGKGDDAPAAGTTPAAEDTGAQATGKPTTDANEAPAGETRAPAPVSEPAAV
jgi:hypothetical protein